MINEAMVPVDFKQSNTVFGAGQEDKYKPLPAFRVGDARGTVLICWKIPFKQRLKLLFSGIIWQYVFTFNRPIQPQLFVTDTPDWEGGEHHDGVRNR